jgi:hypothetical protein
MIHRSDNAAETGSETPKSGHKMWTCADKFIKVG